MLRAFVLAFFILLVSTDLFAQNSFRKELEAIKSLRSVVEEKVTDDILEKDLFEEQLEIYKEYRKDLFTYDQYFQAMFRRAFYNDIGVGLAGFFGVSSAVMFETNSNATVGAILGAGLGYGTCVFALKATGMESFWRKGEKYMRYLPPEYTLANYEMFPSSAKKYLGLGFAAPGVGLAIIGSLDDEMDASEEFFAIGVSMMTYGIRILMEPKPNLSDYERYKSLVERGDSEQAILELGRISGKMRKCRYVSGLVNGGLAAYYLIDKPIRDKRIKDWISYGYWDEEHPEESKADILLGVLFGSIALYEFVVKSDAENMYEFYTSPNYYMSYSLQERDSFFNHLSLGPAISSRGNTMLNLTYTR